MEKMLKKERKKSTKQSGQTNVESPDYNQRSALLDSFTMFKKHIQLYQLTQKIKDRKTSIF